MGCAIVARNRSQGRFMMQIDLILEQMRQGGTVTQGSSRCHVDYGWDAEGFYADLFDEGAIERRRIDEAEIRELHARDPALFAGLLRRHGWRTVRRALDADDLPAARAGLRWMIRTCDLHDNAAVWLAAIGEDAPEAAIVEVIRAKARGKVLWHALMEGFEWQATAATGARAAWLLDRLVERMTGIRGQAVLRARFAAMEADPTPAR